MSDVDAAAKLREEGNEFYKSGEITQAVKKYREASKLAPSDARPISNLSAAYFELGDYGSSAEYADQALELLLMQEIKDKTADARVQALSNRLERCRQYQKPVGYDPDLVYKLTILPRYRPSVALNYEYFAFGHDFIEPLFDHYIDRYAGEDEQINFFFAGIGDARNLFATLIEINQFESQRPSAPRRRFHFTINDIKATPIARDLTMFMLFQDLAELDDFKSNWGSVLLTTLYYIFHGPIMPKVAFQQMQIVIQRLLNSLDEERQPLNWLYIRKEDMFDVARYLRTWQKVVVNTYSTATIIDRVIQSQNVRGYSAVPSYMKTEESVYNWSGVLYPASNIQDEYEPDLKKLLLEAEKSKPKSIGKKIAKYAKERWRINPTLVDVDWLAAGAELDMGHDPFGSIARFFETGLIEKSKRIGSGSLYDRVIAIFTETAEAVRNLKGRIFIEAVVGDFAEVLEQIRLNKIDRDSDNGDLHEFPMLYDRIHMSNIPDYVGGHMTSFLYASPMLKPVDSSWITANCLKNSSSWRNVEEYNAEYLMIPDLGTLDKVLQVKLLARASEDSIFQMSEYHKFGRSSGKSWPYAGLLDRTVFRRWVYNLFFKTAIPWYRDSSKAQAVILAPLNLTVFVRLFARLVEVGYPPHWIVEIINTILSDNVTTTARPPRKMPHKREDLLKDFPAKKLTTGPFVAEMAVQCTMFQPLVPFGLEHELIPPVTSLYHYTFDLRDSEVWVRPDIFNLALVFWDHDAFAAAAEGEPPEDLRPMLDPSWDEIDAKMNRPEIQEWREEGVALWSTFEWDGHRREATVIMDEEFVDMCKRQKWWVGLWRTDSWSKAFTRPVEVRFCVNRGPRWFDDWVR